MPSRYRIVCSQAVLMEFKAVLQQADQQGLRSELLIAAEQIANRLESEPS